MVPQASANGETLAEAEVSLCDKLDEIALWMRSIHSSVKYLEYVHRPKPPRPFGRFLQGIIGLVYETKSPPYTEVSEKTKAPSNKGSLFALV